MPPPTPATTDRSRWLALYVLCAGFLMIVLDGTVVNVALPAIQEDLGFTQSSLAWVVNAYLIAFGGLLLLAGRLGDLAGRKRVFLIGLALFTVSSLLCGLAPSQALLISARFVQGIGGALSSAVILGVIVTMFPEPSEQARAIGVYSFVASAGASIGLLAGGVITQAISWHWIFFINIPIGVAVALLGHRMLEDDPGLGLKDGADAIGATLVTGALMLLVYTIVEAAERGWGSFATLGLLAVSLVLLGAFVARQATAARPLLPLRMFRSRNVSGANLIIILMVAGLFGLFFLCVLYLQDVLGYSAVETGAAFLPVSMTIGAISLTVAPRLVMRFGSRRVLLPGLACAAAGLGWLVRLPADGTYAVDVLPSMALLGLGAGLSFPALMTLAMSGATPEDSGLASGLVNTMQQVGAALGLAILATLASTRTESLLATGEPRAEALTGGYRLAFGVATCLVLVGIVVAATVLQREPATAPDEAAVGAPAFDAP